MRAGCKSRFLLTTHNYQYTELVARLWQNPGCVAARQRPPSPSSLTTVGPVRASLGGPRGCPSRDRHKCAASSITEPGLALLYWPIARARTASVLALAAVAAVGAARSCSPVRRVMPDIVALPRRGETPQKSCTARRFQGLADRFRAHGRASLLTAAGVDTCHPSGHQQRINTFIMSLDAGEVH